MKAKVKIFLRLFVPGILLYYLLELFVFKNEKIDWPSMIFACAFVAAGAALIEGPFFKFVNTRVKKTFNHEKNDDAK